MLFTYESISLEDVSKLKRAAMKTQHFPDIWKATLAPFAPSCAPKVREKLTFLPNSWCFFKNIKTCKVFRKRYSALSLNIFTVNLFDYKKNSETQYKHFNQAKERVSSKNTVRLLNKTVNVKVKRAFGGK